MTKWSEHVKRYAKKHKMSYRQASMSAKCKESYKKKRMSPRRMKMHQREGGGARDEGRGRELPKLERESYKKIQTFLNCHEIAWVRYSYPEGERSIVDNNLKKIMKVLKSKYPEFYNDETPGMMEFNATKRPTWNQFSRVCGKALQLGFAELIRICQTGYNIRKLEQLINMGVYINELDERLIQPLFYALMSGGKNLINILLKNRASISNTEGFIIQALNMEAARSHLKKIPILVAADMGNVDLVRILLDKDPNINLKNYEGQNVLHIAASSKNSSFELIGLLIERGSILDERDHYKKTALHYAAENGNIEAVNTLVMFGANVNAKDKRDETPLMLARKRNHSIVVEMLLEAGALEFERKLDLRELELLEDGY